MVMSGFMPLMGSVRLLDRPSPLIQQNQAPGWNAGGRFPFMAQAQTQPVPPVTPQPVSPPQTVVQPVVAPAVIPTPVAVPTTPTVVVQPVSYLPLAIGLGALALVTVIAVAAGK
jgi:hypothetical protein